jgi:uncharacterized repeat protein (TIGR01451 family)
MVSIAGGLSLIGATPAHAQNGNTLVTDTFTGATAPQFEGFGSACLTGAPLDGTPPNGDHILGGCMTDRIGPVPPGNAAPHGYLQLTGDENDQAGAVLLNQPLPANQGVDITFDQWQYGSTTPPTPADGISFFLVDGAGQLNEPGAFGGSLGYAQKRPNDVGTEILPGVNNGYLGIGLDVLGNYFGDWEHRGNGCERRSPAGTGFRNPAPGPNMVTVRGPGNGTVGYCFLTATTNNFTTTGPWPSTLPGTLQGPTTVVPPDATPQQAETLLEPSRRRVHILITPAPNPHVTVDVDFNDGNGFQPVLSFAAPQPVPPTYKLGFAASTGLFTDIHLIRNVLIRSAEPLPRLNLVKQVRLPLPANIGVGTHLPYDFVVTNSGENTITNLSVADPQIGPVVCPNDPLAPTQTVMCSATYTVTQDDLDRGVIVNTAVAHGESSTGPAESPPSEASVPLGTGVASLSLKKSADPVQVTAAGQKVTYHYDVTNTGEVDLSNLTVRDTDFSGTGTPPEITCEPTTLAPSDEVQCIGTYEVTQADVDKGAPITNTAIASAERSGGATIESNTAEASVAVNGLASLSLVKSADRTTVTAAGQTINYRFRVINNGNVTVTGLKVTETFFSGSGTPPSVTCPDTTTLDPREETTCIASYTVTDADIAAGGVTNTAVATGTAGDQTPVSPPSTASVGTMAGPALSLTKVAEPIQVSAAGQTVSYEYVVTNTGTENLTDLTVTDVTFSGAGTKPVITCDPTTLAPTDQVTCVGTYTVTQEDMDRGVPITNQAVATASPPEGEPITSNPSSAAVTVTSTASLSLVKSADPTAVTQAGQTITYSFQIRNNGTITVTGLTAKETSFSGSGVPSIIDCPEQTLLPSHTTTCESTYVVTQADMDKGSIDDTAVATGTTPGEGTVSSQPSSATVTAEGIAHITLAKSASPLTVTGAGQQISFSFVITNTGTVSLTGFAVAEQSFTGGGKISAVTCPAADSTLAPDGSTTCTAVYTTTDADVRAGTIRNTAVATARIPGGATITSNTATATVTVRAPSLPKTGTNLAAQVGMGGLLTAAGTVLLVAGARRRFRWPL